LQHSSSRCSSAAPQGTTDQEETLNRTAGSRQGARSQSVNKQNLKELIRLE